MKEYPLVARSLQELQGSADRLIEAMSGGEDINYVSLHAFLGDLKSLKESFQILVLTRKDENASIHRPE
ncbi:MAG TPA: hypothetical protein VGM92_01195 [Candidatus Kapabacteria bacterium]